MQQGRFATVGVADDGNHRIRDALPSHATQRPLLADLFDLTVELADPMADPPAVALEFLLARAPGADTGAQAGEVAAPLEARQEMMQLRRFHLQAAFLGASSLREDVEDQLGAVDHLEVELFLQVALLAWGELFVEDEQVEVSLVLQGMQGLDLALAD